MLFCCTLNIDTILHAVQWPVSVCCNTMFWGMFSNPTFNVFAKTELLNRDVVQVNL